MNRILIRALTACLLLLGFLPLLHGETVFIEGILESRVGVSKEMKWAVERPLSQFSVLLPLPINYSNKGVSQSVEALRLEYDPQPAAVEDETDPMGNIQKKITWNNVTKDVRIHLAFEARIRSGLPAMESGEPFPLRNVKGREKAYLRPTTQVQSESPSIISLSKELTGLSKTEHEAATSILNYVADSVKYTYNPSQYDALYTLGAKTGNCTNISHLSIALLRAAGIPARIVGGLTLDKQWKIPINNERHIVHSMGRGGHAWIEIFFPDLGWLAYDPQQSRQFTSTRHIKEIHGLDFMNISITWSGLPYLPPYSQVIDAQFLDDVIDIRPMSTSVTPKLHLVSNQVKARVLPPKEGNGQQAVSRPEQRSLKSERLVPGKPADAAPNVLASPMPMKPELAQPALEPLPAAIETPPTAVKGPPSQETLSFPAVEQPVKDKPPAPQAMQGTRERASLPVPEPLLPKPVAAHVIPEKPKLSVPPPEFIPPQPQTEAQPLLPEPPRAVLEPLMPSGKSKKSPALPDVNGPASPDVNGPALPDIKNPALQDLNGPALPDASGPALPDVRRKEKGTTGKPPKDRVIEIGNMEFPNMVEAYRVQGNRGFSVLDAETAEYVTSQYVYAQAFIVKEAIKVKGLSLAMHKFGGDGSIYVDLVSDDNGKPSLEGARSLPVFLENIERKHGYYWVDFVFSRDESSPVLRAGKYWIILRHSGEAIMSWFYTPGKWYGGGYDTCSTLKGYRWEDILNYDFVFRITAARATSTH